MDITIRIHSGFSARVSRTRLKRIAARTLRAERVRASLGIYITDDAEIRRLNHAYHATNAPTDVLSFPARQMMPRGVTALSEPPYLGDIVISYETASAQARAVEWRIADELDLLLVHGSLHLLGYDDLRPRARARMWRRQEEILKREIKT